MFEKELFKNRHIGISEDEKKIMLSEIGLDTIEELIDKTIPQNIRLKSALILDTPLSEDEYLKQLKQIASKNRIFKSYIGLGYYETITPSVILRNILENPSWYTSYTPYQSEISQGRLEALLNFQTVVTELTAMEIANASLLDEATATAEAMLMMNNVKPKNKKTATQIFVDKTIFPQTIDVLQLRAESQGIELIIDDYEKIEFNENLFGIILQYPNSEGNINDYSYLTQKAHKNDCLVTVAADILSLTILTPPCEWGADIVVGSTQRFGIPMGYGGPHAAYFATYERFKRNIPGRIIGITIDSQNDKAYRMALQTREQHIKRERATSNICTAQALLATMAGMYAVYHGPDGLIRIARRIHFLAQYLEKELQKLGFTQKNTNYFDTLKIKNTTNACMCDIRDIALNEKINIQYVDDETLSISINETDTLKDIQKLVRIFGLATDRSTLNFSPASEITENQFSSYFIRQSEFMKQDLFRNYQTETKMMRYIKKLERKDFSLTHSMISLGSCTMKLNAATEMLPLTWAEFTNLHPFAPVTQAEGYQQIFEELKTDLAKITGFDDISLQPNSGAAGEYTGLMIIRQYFIDRNETNRNIVLIPASAHGTNPASAAMAGMEVVVVACDQNGNIDKNDLIKKAEQHSRNLSAIMITYPSTHGVFEDNIVEICKIIHQNGGQIYMDGANMNAQVGLTNPAIIGADVCHLNLHKTFAIPHGGGGPGVGPIGVAKHLKPYLPSHTLINTARNTQKAIKAVSAAPWGSANIQIISHSYLKMMGGQGLKEASEIAILNANYLANKLANYFPILYTGTKGYVAHELIIDCRPIKQKTGITEVDIAKRLIDYGFHAPTLSFPVAGTLMIEPTESESFDELQRFVESMKNIYNEIKDIEEKKRGYTQNNNPLRNAPHTQKMLASSLWNYPYCRKTAAFPLNWIIENKFWPAVSRINDAHGDRNFCCVQN